MKTDFERGVELGELREQVKKQAKRIEELEGIIDSSLDREDKEDTQGVLEVLDGLLQDKGLDTDDINEVIAEIRTLLTK